MPYRSARATYSADAAIAAGMPYRGWKSGVLRIRHSPSGRSAAAATLAFEPSKYFPLSTPPARQPYGSPTTPKRYAASHVSPSYVRLSSEKSFWHETGRGQPSLSAAKQNIVIPNAFSFESPQCLIRPRSSSRFTLFTCASNTSTPASPAGSAVAAGTGRLVYSFTFPPSPLGSG